MTKPRRKPDSPTKVVSISLTESEHGRLKALAELLNTSVSGVIRWLLKIDKERNK